jgi:hypothetical protein
LENAAAAAERWGEGTSNRKAEDMNARKWQVIGNIITLVFTLVMNTLANVLPLNGRTTGEISDSFDALFTPAGYVFSIWGLIYLVLVGFTFFQALPAQQANPRVQATGWWVAVANLANGIWIVFWHYGLFGFTLAAIVTLLAALLVLYRRVNAPDRRPADRATRWLVQAPISLYLGWVSVATIANAAVVLLWLGWDGGGQGVLWTMVLILVAAGLALLLRDPIYTLVIAWAVLGILIRRVELGSIVLACSLALAICAGTLVDSLVKKVGTGKRARAG